MMETLLLQLVRIRATPSCPWLQEEPQMCVFMKTPHQGSPRTDFTLLGEKSLCYAQVSLKDQQEIGEVRWASVCSQVASCGQI